MEPWWENSRFHWDFEGLSHNPTLTLEQIRQHLGHPWNWFKISKQSWVSLLEIETHICPWRWDGVSLNPNLTPEFLEKHINYPWDWMGLSLNMNLPITYLFSHPEHPWNWSCVSLRADLTLSIILIHQETPWEWANLSNNPAITWNEIEQHMGCPWNWHYLSFHPNLSFVFLTKHLDRPWYWNALTYNKNFDLLEIEKFLEDPRFAWVPLFLSTRSDLTLEVLSKHPYYPWDYNQIVIQEHQWDLSQCSKWIASLTSEYKLNLYQSVILFHQGLTIQEYTQFLPLLGNRAGYCAEKLFTYERQRILHILTQSMLD